MQSILDRDTFVTITAIVMALRLGFFAALTPQVAHTEEFMAGMKM